MADNSLIGRGWTFPVGPGGGGGVALSEGHGEIEESIRIILGTAQGERVMRPTFGCRIHELVFAPTIDETVGLAERYVREALAMWEPRIDVESVRAELNPEDRAAGRMEISVTYTVRDLKDPRTLVYPFYLIENE
jgi:phage baseplate assembly protein W